MQYQAKRAILLAAGPAYTLNINRANAHEKALQTQRFGGLRVLTHHMAGLSLRSLMFCLSSVDMGRFSGVLRGGIGDMNQRW